MSAQKPFAEKQHYSYKCFKNTIRNPKYKIDNLQYCISVYYSYMRLFKMEKKWNFLLRLTGREFSKAANITTFKGKSEL